eukprot:6000229-Pyramimonas_sp.AAC.1
MSTLSPPRSRTPPGAAESKDEGGPRVTEAPPQLYWNAGEQDEIIQQHCRLLRTSAGKNEFAAGRGSYGQ